ncbi:MAG: bifunctional folylpolyglutamate synthase/dihydrofolate synthase [Thermoplasmata archaeon]|nr:bifunctional folylpolyglutamate synthase/dihydrofolate synthase [Thermoplasmata archaeon]
MSDEAYRRTLDRLFALRRFGMRPGLEVVRSLLGALGDPQASFTSVHITGSKGKGSVAAMVAGILGASGRTVGRFTSPHLQSYRERIHVGDRPISQREVVEGVERVARAGQALLSRGSIDREPTFFEVTTALAFDHFRRTGVDTGVIEVGLGGRLDSTNVLDAPSTGIVTIELEHTDILGPTLADVAREKAGILHPGTRTVVGELPPGARSVVDRIADQLGVAVWHLGEEVQVVDRTLHPKGQTLSIALPHRTVERVELRLLGHFQSGNAAVAIALSEVYAESAGFALSDRAIRDGLAHVRWRGRLELVRRRPDLYLDVAHTPESVSAVARSIAEIQPFEDPAENVVMFGCLKDKKAEQMLDRLSPVAQTVVLVPVRSERTAPLELLRLAAQGRFPRIVQAPDVPTGLRLARVATGPDGFTLALGSDYLVGEILDVLDGGGEAAPDLSDPADVPAPAPATSEKPASIRSTRRPRKA